ncbi:hypothetical protein [Mycobacterium sp. MMS18-G62]
MEVPARANLSYVNLNTAAPQAVIGSTISLALPSRTILVELTAFTP